LLFYYLISAFCWLLSPVCCQSLSSVCNLLSSANPIYDFCVG
jgi:hypothetical protein